MLLRSIRLAARRRWALVSVALTIALIFGYNAATEGPPSTPKVEYDDQLKAHFVRPSSFRENPDLEFEAKLDAGLREVQRRALAANGGSYEADNVIWQMNLGEILAKSPESIALQERNEGEWAYSVGSINLFSLYVLKDYAKRCSIAISW